MNGRMHRAATVDDLPAIQRIEVAAGDLFRTVGMDSIADDPPIAEPEFARFVDHGGAWVARDEGDSVVAYLLVETVDACAHIEQITVDPTYARRGIGASLLSSAESWARDEHLDALTLTTFRDIRWNAPYYARVGFAVLPADQWGIQLRDRVEREAAAGYSRWPRVVMKRALAR